MPKDRTLDHPGFDGGGFSLDKSIPRGVLRFSWDDTADGGAGQMDIDFNMGQIHLHGEIGDAAKAFWCVVYKLSQAMGTPVIAIKQHGKAMIEADVRTGGIWHAFDDESAKFLLNEFEIRAQSEF